MRVITGKAKGKKLKEVPGNTTRPITDRAKEALFSILGEWVVEARILDLFGGTGAVGIEVLSRGGQHATFIDKAYPAYRTIQDNLKHTGLSDQATVIKGDAFKFLADYSGQPFDIIFIAPPQYKGLWQKALTLVDAQPQHLTGDGMVIVQIHPKEFEELALENLELYDQRQYGSVMLCFYEKPELDSTEEE